jgi:hypothetical protein
VAPTLPEPTMVTFLRMNNSLSIRTSWAKAPNL